ncbi:MAG: GNAT family N-acetyltransferase [Candidatus Andeanibacterium colombiense]|uniref:GNAT family N-acetyltransferase n=1 Tax=Candidatus Andeanibacterium colombiense TaxID=3121345 RepID=A0AAJ5XAA5_9SPHN|nr:MAG: GNAT family N-acetyltransferase [Sphingomonadaceae bacterium]
MTARDEVDHIMEVMETAFDPAYGEAWSRRQVSDAVILGNCRALLLDADGRPRERESDAAGFLLSRATLDEEELLLIAVRPDFRGQGIGGALIERLIAEAKMRGIVRLFLEMREGNPAEFLYRKYGFKPIGRRKNYYNRGSIPGIDAISFALSF